MPRIALCFLIGCGGSATLVETPEPEPLDAPALSLPGTPAGGVIPDAVHDELNAIVSALVAYDTGADGASLGRFPTQQNAFVPALRVCPTQPRPLDGQVPTWLEEIEFRPEVLHARYSVEIDTHQRWAIRARVDVGCDLSESELVMRGQRNREGTLVALGLEVFAPTPFTADEIRRACPPGRWSTYRLTTSTGTVHMRTEFIRHTQEGAVLATSLLDSNGEPGPASEVERTWEDLRRHASHPANATTIEWVDIETTAGHFPAWLYTVVDVVEGTRTQLWFARELAGPPVFGRVEAADGTLISESELEAVQVMNPAVVLEHVIGGVHIGMTSAEAEAACNERGTYSNDGRPSCNSPAINTTWRVRDDRVCYVAGTNRQTGSMLRLADEQWGVPTEEEDDPATLIRTWRVNAEVGARVRVTRSNAPYVTRKVWQSIDCLERD